MKLRALRQDFSPYDTRGLVRCEILRNGLREMERVYRRRVPGDPTGRRSRRIIQSSSPGRLLLVLLVYSTA